MISNGYNPDAYLMTKILMLYARSGCLDDLCYARKLFEEMPERNLTAWNTMILAYARVDDYMEVLRLYGRMRGSGNFSDKFTFPSVIKACIAMEDMGGVRQLQSSVVKAGLNCNLFVGGALVDGYARFGWMDDAVTSLDEIEGTSVVTWNAVIAGVCGALRSRDGGKQVHSKLIACGFKGDTFVGNSLIDMYAKCGDEESCLKVFDEMGERNQVTWNSIISAEAQFGHFNDALVLFLRMQESGYKSNRFNLGSILMASAGMADIGKGHELHGHLVRNLLDSDIFLGSALVDMYSKCGMVEEAHQVFRSLLERNEVSYNALLAGYVQEGKAEEALELYHDMQSEDGIQPDQFTFTTLLTLCANQGNDNQGRQIHAHLIRANITKNIIVETELVHMYSECGRLNYAKEIFNRMAERNAYSWNSMIEGYQQNGKTQEALRLFKQMQLNGIKPDCFSLSSMLSSCVSLSDSQKGRELHNFIVRNTMEEEGILQVVLVDMYAKCGSMNYAWKVYDQTIKKDVILNNVMVSAFVNSGRANDAKNLFDQMEQRNTASWNSILAGYANKGLKRKASITF
ncbi:Pentatricopeptide repeat-containing protein [Vitis vinifera]|uniref:Pentatricopeptide repeat-containing protein n=1 Tax=Vitis vinifera TaxID=29760 RepID=A0A438I5T7_VITVI|nr:Pentatricopeptide repeat-containing protein [Vitis vinifera]